MLLTLLYLFTLSAYSVMSSFNGTLFPVWSVPMKGLSCVTTTKMINNTDYKTCSQVCERMGTHLSGDCKAISYDTHNKICNLCGGYLTIEAKNQSLIYSRKFIGRTISHGEAAILLSEAEQFDLIRGGLRMGSNDTQLRRRRLNGNTCQYSANNNDIIAAKNQMIAACEKEFGKRPDRVQVNADEYPYKMCLVPKEAIFEDPNPRLSTGIVATKIVKNDLPQTVSKTIKLTGEYTQQETLSSTNKLDLSVSVSFDVGLPVVGSTKWSVQTTLSTSETTTHSTTEKIKMEDSIQTTLFPGQKIEVALNIETRSFESTFKVPICLEGYFRCQFSPRVNGHYYWYLWASSHVDKNLLCKNQNGKWASSFAFNSHLETKELEAGYGMPTRKPTPKPTLKPTPRPTPKPTPKPTPMPWIKKWRAISGRTLNYPTLTVCVDPGYKLIGGGAWIAWEEPGIMLRESYPSGNCWVGTGKAHKQKAYGKITVHAIGIYDPLNKLDVKIFYAKSGASNWPRAVVAVGSGYTMVGGGASTIKVDSGSGSLLWLSRPLDGRTWEARSKDHMTSSRNTVTAYAIGVRFRDGSRFDSKYELKQTYARSERRAHPVATVYGPSGYVTIGGGAYVQFSGQGNMLTGASPNYWDPSIFKCFAKDHLRSDPAYVHCYSIALRRR